MGRTIATAIQLFCLILVEKKTFHGTAFTQALNGIESMHNYPHKPCSKFFLLCKIGFLA